MNARSYSWHRNTLCRGGGNISSPGEMGGPDGPHIQCVTHLALAGIKSNSCWFAWPDCSPLLLLIRTPLEHCIRFGTLVEAQASWGDLRELCWVSSWDGDRRRGGGAQIDLVLCHDPGAVEEMKPDSSQMCRAGEEAAAMDYSKEKSDWIQGQNSSQY